MVTGHREIHERDLVGERLDRVIARFASEHENFEAVSGGAEGADTLWAEAAIRAGVPFELMLPNRWYQTYYPKAVTRHVADHAARTVHVIDRPDVADWRARWGAERWWQDNFSRNTKMIDTSEVAVVISDRHPRQLAGETKGGTAHAVRQLLRREAKVLWVPDRTDRDACWVQLRTQDAV